MHLRALSLLTVLALTGLAGCTQFPELDRTITPGLEDADYPELVPVEPLLVQATAGRVDPLQTETVLLGRLSRLRARAARLRGSVLSGRERQRLRNGLQ